MKIHKRPDPELLHVATAALRVWLIDVCVWLAERLGVKLPRAVRMDMRRELARALRDARMLVVLLAVSRMRIPVLPARTTRPGAAPPGFRRARTAGEGRVYTRGLHLRGRTLAARLTALRDLFDTLEGAVRRMLRHLRRHNGRLAIVLIAATVERLRDLSAVAITSADTS